MLNFRGVPSKLPWTDSTIIVLYVRIIIAIFCGGSSWTPLKIRRASTMESHGSQSNRFESILLKHISFEISFQKMSFYQNPRGSMYGIFTYIYHINQPIVGKYTIHGSYGKIKHTQLFLTPWILVVHASRSNPPGSKGILEPLQTCSGKGVPVENTEKPLWDLDLPKGAKWF